MLNGNFYSLLDFTIVENDGEKRYCHAVIQLNDHLAVFQGHFPGNPVVPGVFQIQMVRELAAKAIGCPLRLTESDNIKFLSMVVPHPAIQLEFDLNWLELPGTIHLVSAVITSGTEVCLKFKGKFIPAG